MDVIYHPYRTVTKQHEFRYEPKQIINYIQFTPQKYLTCNLLTSLQFLRAKHYGMWDCTFSRWTLWSEPHSGMLQFRPKDVYQHFRDMSCLNLQDWKGSKSSKPKQNSLESYPSVWTIDTTQIFLVVGGGADICLKTYVKPLKTIGTDHPRVLSIE